MRLKKHIFGLMLALGVLLGASAAVGASLPGPTPTPRVYPAFCQRQPGPCHQPVPTSDSDPRAYDTAPADDRAAMQQFWAAAFSLSSMTGPSGAAADGPSQREASPMAVVLTSSPWTRIAGVNDTWKAPLDVNGEPYGDCAKCALDKLGARMDQGRSR